MTYDFSRFTSQSFERFSQALVTRKFGPGIRVYGDGPDGAREASFEGHLDIQSHGGAWDGYVVVQAKHRRNPRGGADDAAWLERELKKEFAKFLDPRRNLRKPEFYLIISNVSLTSASSHKTLDGRVVGAGGQETIENFIQSKQQELELRGWLVWHADLLTAMLDTESELRTRFSAWVTEGDVLSAALATLSRPTMTDVVPLSIKRELKKDRDVKRKDAGQVTEKRIFVDDVFVDLPLNLEGAYFDVEFDSDEDEIYPELEIDQDVGDESEEESESVSDETDIVDLSLDENGVFRRGVVARLLHRASDKLDPESLAATCNQKRPRPNRVVLLGGPGQGKSTLAQFLVQIFRAAVVLSDAKNLPTDETKEAADAIVHRCVSEGLSIKNARRFPLLIELPKFADAAKQVADTGGNLSLLRFAMQQLAKLTDYTLDPSDLRRWLGLYPWLLVLDGLDEVPATGNRSEVISSINDFWDDVHEAHGDVFVLVTTRPQGYGDDLSRRLWEHWPMANLDPDDAMRFAGRLANVLLSDGSRRDEVLGELKRASEDQATAPIMISPLQVSILFSLVETRGGIPADRWSLFQRHYTLLRDREAAKEGSTAKLLRDYATQIDQIHYDAGYLLHVRAEVSGSADSFLLETEFDELVIAQLKSEGYDDEKIKEVTAKISYIATQRLVLLGCKTGGRIAFDVRSLQEFMAAARIMSSPEIKILDRLREIAARTHWRHVFRIAASKAFALAELAHLRPQIIHVCDALDQGDLSAADRIAGTGSLLALDLLSDNVAVRFPELRRSLVTRALKVLDLGSKAVTGQLAVFLDSDTRQTFELELNTRLVQGETQSAKGAWKLLLITSNSLGKHREWADRLLTAHWPDESAKFVRIMHSLEIIPESPTLLGPMRKVLIEEGPAVTRRLLYQSFSMRRETLPDALTDLFPAAPIPSNRVMIHIRNESGKRIGFRFSATPIEEAPSDLPSEIRDSSKWLEVNIAAEFRRNPSARTLNEVIKKLAIAGLGRLPLGEYPWPLASVLAEANSSDDLNGLADAALEGAFGDIEDWKRAEQRWLTEGVRYEDLAAWKDVKFISSDIAEKGAPFPSSLFTPPARFSSESDTVIEILRPLVNVLPDGARRRLISSFMLRLGTKASARTKEELLDWALQEWRRSNQPIDRWYSSFLFSLPDETFKREDVVELLDAIGNRTGSAIPLMHAEKRKDFIQNMIANHPNCRGLIRFLHPRQSSSSGRKLKIEIPNAALELTNKDSAVIRAEVGFFRCISGKVTNRDAKAIASDILAGFSGSQLIETMEMILGSAIQNGDFLVALVGELCTKARELNNDVYGDSLVILKRLLDRRHSRLDNQEVAAMLQLPRLPHAKAARVSVPI